MTRRFLAIGYVLLNTCLLLALIGHASYMFATVEHTGSTLYPQLAALAMEGSLAYVTIARLLLKLAEADDAKALLRAQVALVCISAYVNLRQAQGATAAPLLLFGDQVVLSITLPIFLAVNAEVGKVVLRQGKTTAGVETQPINPNAATTIVINNTAQAGVQAGATYPATAQVADVSAEEVAARHWQPQPQPPATYLAAARKLPSETTIAALSQLGSATVAEVAGATGKSATWERQQLQLAVASQVAEVVAGSSPARYKLRIEREEILP